MVTKTINMEAVKLYQCPYEKACKCSQMEPCNGCETWADYHSGIGEGNYILMPKSLTAENGAKFQLIGEFSEGFTQSCVHCDGEGRSDNGDDCEYCDGNGEKEVLVIISWITIKEIYKMAVKHLGKSL